MKTYFKKIRHENYTQKLCIELYYFLKMENNLSKEKEKSLVLPETNRWEASWRTLADV